MNNNTQLIRKIKALRVKAVGQLTYYQFRLYNEMQSCSGEAHLDEIPYLELSLITENRYVHDLIAEINELKQVA